MVAILVLNSEDGDDMEEQGQKSGPMRQLTVPTVT